MVQIPNRQPCAPATGSAPSDAWFTPGRFGAFLALAIVGAFPKVVLGLHTFFYRDFGVLGYPMVHYHHESFWRGEFPLWNPLSNCGAPFLAQWGTMALYPFSLFYLLLPLPWSLNVFCLAHLFWAGLGMYFLALRWVGNRFGASLAGTAFVFNGITFSCLIWPNYTVALGWMPWAILWSERAWQEGGRRLTVAALAATMQMLAGVPEIVLLTWLLLLGVWIEGLLRRTTPIALSLNSNIREGRPVADPKIQGWRRAVSPSGSGSWVTRALRKPSNLYLSRAVGMVVLVCGLSAAQLCPFFELLTHSQRSSEFATAKWAMPAWGWANLVVPLFRCFLTPQGIFFQIGQEFMSSTYVGVTVLLLGIYAVCTVRERRVAVLAVMAAFALLMAMGENCPFYRWVKHGVPLLGFARYPIKFVVLVAFVFPLLSAYAARTLLSLPSVSRREPGWRILFVLGLGLWLAIALVVEFTRQYPTAYDQWPALLWCGIWRCAFLGAAVGFLAIRLSVQKPTGRRAAELGLLSLLILDVLTHVPKQNPTLPAYAVAPGLWEMHNKTSPPRHGQGRVMISPYAEQHLLLSRVPDLYSDWLGKRLALWSNLNILEGASKVNGSSTLQIREQMEVQSLLYASTNTDWPGLADFLAVAQVTVPGQIVEWTRRETALPLVTGGQRPVFAGAAEILRNLTNANFHAAEVVYLPPEAQPFVMVTNRTEVSIRSWNFASHQIKFEADAQLPSLLVIAQTFYPSWHAYVDGQRTTLWRANHAFQALQVPRGSHQIKIVYEDSSFVYGAAISALALALCVFSFLRRNPAASGGISSEK